jgi:hypothetical protein
VGGGTLALLNGPRPADDAFSFVTTGELNMRSVIRIILVAMILLTIPAWTSAGPKHGQRIQELAHKKRLKKAKKQSPGSPKLLHKHSGG